MTAAGRCNACAEVARERSVHSLKLFELCSACLARNCHFGAPSIPAPYGRVVNEVAANPEVVDEVNKQFKRRSDSGKRPESVPRPAHQSSRDWPRIKQADPREVVSAPSSGRHDSWSGPPDPYVATNVDDRFLPSAVALTGRDTWPRSGGSQHSNGSLRSAQEDVSPTDSKGWSSSSWGSSTAVNERDQPAAQDAPGKRSSRSYFPVDPTKKHPRRDFKHKYRVPSASTSSKSSPRHSLDGSGNPRRSLETRALDARDLMDRLRPHALQSVPEHASYVEHPSTGRQSDRTNSTMYQRVASVASDLDERQVYRPEKFLTGFLTRNLPPRDIRHQPPLGELPPNSTTGAPSRASVRNTRRRDSPREQLRTAGDVASSHGVTSRGTSTDEQFLASWPSDNPSYLFHDGEDYTDPPGLHGVTRGRVARRRGRNISHLTKKRPETSVPAASISTSGYTRPSMFDGVATNTPSTSAESAVDLDGGDASSRTGQHPDDELAATAQITDEIALFFALVSLPWLIWYTW